MSAERVLLRARTGDEDEAPSKGTNVIDLMAALKASLKGTAGEEGEPAKAPRGRKAAAKEKRPSGPSRGKGAEKKAG